MEKQESPSPVWQAAWHWVIRSHERDRFDDAARAELAQWLAADEQHRKQYDKACRLWLLSGLVPPAFEDQLPAQPRDL